MRNEMKKKKKKKKKKKQSQCHWMFLIDTILKIFQDWSVKIFQDYYVLVDFYYSDELC